MNVDIVGYRPSFNIAILSSDASLSHRFMTVMAVEGYTVKTFAGLEALQASGKEFPPHIILLDHSIVKVPDLLPQLSSIFPATFFYLLGLPEDLDQVVTHLKNFKGVIPQGKITTRVLTALLDNALEQLLLRYEVEKKTSATTPDDVVDGFRITSHDQIIDINDFSGTGGNDELNRFVDWSERLSAVEHYEEAIKSYTNELYDRFECDAVIYFKYMSAYASLVATHSEGIPFQKVRGLGLNFSEDRHFDPQKDLLKMDEYRPFVKMVENVVEEKKMATSVLIVDGQVRGLFALVGVSPAIKSEPYFRACELLVQRWLSEVLLKERIHNLERHDDLTGCLNKRTFSEQVFLEVGRARRIKLPVSYVYISIDHIQNIKKELNADRYRTLLKMVAKVIEQAIRKTDFAGRMGENEFAILFPHMNYENLKVKATRLKRMLETAKYFNDLKKEFSLSTTICISEYPSSAYDAEDLMLAAAQKVIAEESSSQLFVMSKGDSFVPDFEPGQGG